MPFAYMLECADGSYYVGSTWDLERRVSEHNEGLGAEYTKRRRPVRLVWSTQLDRIDEAYWYEKQIQGWGRAKRQALIEGRYEDLPRLARTSPIRRDGESVVSTSSTDGNMGSTDGNMGSTDGNMGSTDGNMGSTDGHRRTPTGRRSDDLRRTHPGLVGLLVGELLLRLALGLDPS
jgi:putative endonuclease